MANSVFNPENQKKIKVFLDGMGDIPRTIARELLEIHNTADCGPEVMGLKLKYGDHLSYVLDKIEGLRQDIGCDYQSLQRGLLRQI